MASSISRSLDISPVKKYGFFILILFIFSAFSIFGYKQFMMGRTRLAETVIFMNAMGYLAFLWILSGFLDSWLLAKVLFIGLAVATLTYFLSELVATPSSQWQDQIALVVSESTAKYLPKYVTTNLSQLNFLGPLCIFILFFAFCTLFFFLIIYQQDDSALQIFRFGLIIIIFFDLLAALPLILVKRSQNLGPDTRNMIFVSLFGILLLNSLIFLVFYWSMDYIPDGAISLGDIELSITPTVFAFMICSFIALVMAPYISGWRVSKKWRIVLLEKRLKTLEELLDILELCKPTEYSSRLKALIEKIESNIRDFRVAYTLFPEHIVDSQGRIKLEVTICGPGLLTMDPRLFHLQALGSLKSNLLTNLDHLEGIWGGDDALTQKANELAGFYRIRKDEIWRQIEEEKKTRLSLWVDLSPIIYTMITVFFSVMLRYMIESSDAKEMVLEMVKMIPVAPPI